MLTIDLDKSANVVVLPRQLRGGAVATARRNLSVAGAIRYVMEGMPVEERPRAVVQTP